MAFPRNEVEAIGWDWIANLSVQNKPWLLRQFLPLGQMTDKSDVSLSVRYFSRLEMLRQFSEYCTPVHEINNISVGDTGDCIHDTKDTHEGYLRLRTKHLKEDQQGSDLTIRKVGTKQFLCGTRVLENSTQSEEKHIACAIRCPKFHANASEWDSRERSANWPSDELRKEVKSLGCYVVPKHHTLSKHPALEWQFDFSKAEEQLANDLNDTQLECYTLLKMFYDREFKRPQFLTTAHLKTVLFRACERLPRKQWRDDKLGDCLMLLLDELLSYLIQNVMPHYFIAGNNMLDHVHEDFIWEMQQKICDVRQNPVQFLFSLRRLEIPDFAGIPPHVNS